MLTKALTSIILAFVVLQSELPCTYGHTDLVSQELVNEFKELKKTVQRQADEIGQLKERIQQLEANQMGHEKTSANRMVDHADNRASGTSNKRFVVDNEFSSVAFTAYLDHRYVNLGPDQPIAFNQVLLNEGNAYNNISGMFTAPLGGIYIFSFSVTCTRFTGEPAEEIRVKLLVNNTHQLTAIAQSNTEYDDNQGGSTAILHVNQGDVVWIGHHSSIGDNLFSNDDLRVTSFTGALLSVD